MNRTPPVAKFEMSAFTLNSLFKSGVAKTSLIVKISFSCLNAFCCSSSHFYFSSFLVSLFKGNATFAKSFTKHL